MTPWEIWWLTTQAGKPISTDEAPVWLTVVRLVGVGVAISCMAYSIYMVLSNA